MAGGGSSLSSAAEPLPGAVSVANIEEPVCTALLWEGFELPGDNCWHPSEHQRHFGVVTASLRAQQLSEIRTEEYCVELQS